MFTFNSDYTISVPDYGYSAGDMKSGYVEDIGLTLGKTRKEQEWYGCKTIREVATTVSAL